MTSKRALRSERDEYVEAFALLEDRYNTMLSATVDMMESISLVAERGERGGRDAAVMLRAAAKVGRASFNNGGTAINGIEDPQVLTDALDGLFAGFSTH